MQTKLIAGAFAFVVAFAFAARCCAAQDTQRFARSSTGKTAGAHLVDDVDDELRPALLERRVHGVLALVQLHLTPACLLLSAQKYRNGHEPGDLAGTK